MIAEYMLLAGVSLIGLYVGAVVFAAVGSSLCVLVLKCIAKEAKDDNA